MQQGPAAPRGQESQEFRVIPETVLPSMTGRFPQGLDLVGRSSLGSSQEQRRWGQRQFWKLGCAASPRSAQETEEIMTCPRVSWAIYRHPVREMGLEPGTPTVSLRPQADLKWSCWAMGRGGRSQWWLDRDSKAHWRTWTDPAEVFVARIYCVLHEQSNSLT